MYASFFKQRCLLIITGLLFCISSYAQDLSIKGILKDETGKGVPGANLQIKGTKNTVATDFDGSFQIKASIGSELIVSFIGFETRTIKITSPGTLDIVLKTSSKELQEIVVVGYGTSKKKDLTGAITTVKSQDITGRRTVQVSDALQGAMAGVTVSRNGAAPGSQSKIRFRGVTTIGVSGNDPLIIVDGVPTANIDYLNPDDIESITALKDAASTAIYGSRAAAGVLLVTTRRAKAGKTSLEYSYEYAQAEPVNQPATTGAVRYMQLYNEYLANDGAAPLYSQATITNYNANHAANPDLYPDTDWQKSIIKNNAPRIIHNLAFSSGSENVKSRATLGYSSSDALYDNRGFKKLNAGVYNDFKFSNKLTASFDVSAVRTENKDVNIFNNNVFLDARVMAPIYDDYYSDGRYALGKDGRNAVAQIGAGGFKKFITNNLSGRIAVNFKPFKGLTLTGQASPTIIFGPVEREENGQIVQDPSKQFIKVVEFTDMLDPSKKVAVGQQPASASLNESKSYNYRFNGQFVANYNNSFSGKHNLDATFGYENNYSYVETIRASRATYTLSNYPYLDNGLPTFRDNGGSAYETALSSYFGRVSYNFKNRYYLQAGGRYDGSSRFNQDQRWAFFPSLGAGWAVSEEPFFKSVKEWGVDFLKFRASWGQSGNERIGNYPYQASISLYNSLFYQNGVVVAPTSGSQVNYAVDDITWETQESTNIGLDATFLNNRLTLSGDVFYKQTKDILLKLNVPLYLGYDAPFQNAGKVSSKGFEATVSWSDNIGTDWKYSVGANISDAKTNVDDLKGTSILGDTSNIEGNEFAAWYGYKSSGIFQTAAEVAASPKTSASTKPGDIKYVDIDGDGQITPDKDRVILGGSLPRYTFGLNGKLSYKTLDFSFVAYGVGKQQVRLSNYAVQPFQETFGNVPTLIDGKFWSATNTAEQNAAAEYPRLSNASSGNNYAMSDFWLVNGSYLRIKNITLGYNFNKKITDQLGIQGLRLYVAGNDLFTISHFPKGSDPEVDAISYPIVKTFMTGLNVKF
ncbi:TonB-dependent receptor [Flavobacterium circumlabens]|uniref:TonB-dependent receptor n=1 Tax=Flavobacterium circumlabens TaxID=2133765 RepID=A0A4Y7UED9_9FLAO|nr:TonB-dependent receptor [Flavobacterium circumlabens]TCN59521.1 TonB-linked SusC/RagA family outer membrane protein [Flavobacterium circumlabens]TEB44813.1 TonB-dependent receptor [Flavobacterium circumlabens]